MRFSPKIGRFAILLALAALAGAPALAGEEEAGLGFLTGKWTPLVSAQAKAGDERALGRLGVMAPLVQGESDLLFADLRLVVDDDDSLEGNVGLGVRHIFRDEGNDLFSGLIAGLYGFYDRKRSDTHHEYDQLTFGAELLGENFELRGNLYLPDEERNLLGTRGVSGFRLSGIRVVRDTTVIGAYEQAVPGFDAEFGLGAEVLEDVSLWAHAGYYFFDDSGFPAIEGPRGRLTVQWADPAGLAGASVGVGLEVQDDSVQGTDTMGFLTVRLPLGAPADGEGEMDGLDRAMMRSIERDVDVIVFGQDLGLPPGAPGGPEILGGYTRDVRHPATGKVIRVFFVDANGSRLALGTQRYPLTARQAEAAARRGDVIFFLANDGPINVVGEGLRMKNYQQYVGAGGDGVGVIQLPGGSLRIRAGGRPYLQGARVITGEIAFGLPPVETALVQLANNVRVDGVGLDTGVMGLAGMNANNVTVNDIVARGFDWAGVGFTNGSNLSVTNSSFRNIGMLLPVGKGAENALVLARGAVVTFDAAGTVDVAGNVVRNCGTGATINQMLGGRVQVSFTGNRVVNPEFGFLAHAENASRIFFDVSDNVFVRNGEALLPRGEAGPEKGAGNSAVYLSLGWGAPLMRGQVRRNRIFGDPDPAPPPGPGAEAAAATWWWTGIQGLADGGDLVVNVSDNVISECFLSNILMYSWSFGAEPTRIDATIANNRLGMLFGALDGPSIDLYGQSNGVPTDSILTANVNGNSVDRLDWISLRTWGGTVRVENLPTLGARNGTTVLQLPQNGGPIVNVPAGTTRTP